MKRFYQGILDLIDFVIDKRAIENNVLDIVCLFTVHDTCLHGWKIGIVLEIEVGAISLFDDFVTKFLVDIVVIINAVSNCL